MVLSDQSFPAWQVQGHLPGQGTAPPGRWNCDYILGRVEEKDKKE